MQKNLGYAIGLLIGFVVLVVTQLPSTKTKMIVCDVGQGDAILIVKGNNQALIDGGPSSEKILSCLSRYMPFWDHNIELIVLTNTDYDHMNGLSTVLMRYSNTLFVTADGVHSSDALDRLVTTIKQTGTRVNMVEQGEAIRVGKSHQLTFQVLWPPKVNTNYLVVFSGQIDDSERKHILGATAKSTDFNERSVVLLLEENGYKTLLTGDAGDQAEKKMLEEGILSKVDYLKVGHHGSRYASSQAFLEKISPSVAIISVGAKNKYGHPTEDAMARLTKVGAKIRRTDQEGNIVISF